MRFVLLPSLLLTLALSACGTALVKPSVRQALARATPSPGVVEGHPSHVAARVSGGAYRLLGDGRLLRVDRRAQPTGVWPTSLVQIASSGTLVCGLGNDRELYCLRDRSSDQRCGSDAKLPMLVGLGVRFEALDGLGRDGQVCGRTADERWCVRVAARCDLACLSFPTCADPERCVAPCVPGEAPLAVVRVTSKRRAEETFNDFRP